MIKTDQLTFSKNCGDPVGRVAFFKGRIFRLINDEYVHQVDELMRSGLVDDLSRNNKFLKSWICLDGFEDFNLVIESEYISDWNYAFEWSPKMLRDAAVMVFEINEVAKKYGYQLIDPHNANVIFRNNSPVYIDLGSFKKLDATDFWLGYQTYISSFILPLKLIFKGMPELAYSILRMQKDLPLNEVGSLIGFNIVKNNVGFLFYFTHPIIAIFKLSNHSLSNNSLISRLLILRNIFTAVQVLARCIARLSLLKMHHWLLSVKFPDVSYWGGYHKNLNASADPRVLALAELISSNTMGIDSLLDIGANHGDISIYLKNYLGIKKVISTDYDLIAVDAMYEKYKSEDGFYCAVQDVLAIDAIGSRESFASRINVDAVLALALTHHLILSQGVGIQGIFEILEKLSAKYIIVEFMPLGLWDGVSSIRPAIPSYYTFDWFDFHFSKKFNKITHQKLAENRIVFIGIKKDIQFSSD